MEENKFTKEQIRNSETFKEYKDIVTAFFNDEESYTTEQAKTIIDNYLKREVK